MNVIKINEFKGNNTFAIHKDEETEHPIIAFQLKKAKAIVDNIEAIKKFIVEEEKLAVAQAVQTDKTAIAMKKALKK